MPKFVALGWVSDNSVGSDVVGSHRSERSVSESSVSWVGEGMCVFPMSEPSCRVSHIVASFGVGGGSAIGVLASSVVGMELLNRTRFGGGASFVLWDGGDSVVVGVAFVLVVANVIVAGGVISAIAESVFFEFVGAVAVAVVFSVVIVVVVSVFVVVVCMGLVGFFAVVVLCVIAAVIVTVSAGGRCGGELVVMFRFLGSIAVVGVSIISVVSSASSAILGGGGGTSSAASRAVVVVVDPVVRPDCRVCVVVGLEVLEPLGPKCVTSDARDAVRVACGIRLPCGVPARLVQHA